MDSQLFNFLVLKEIRLDEFRDTRITGTVEPMQGTRGNPLERVPLPFVGESLMRVRLVAAGTDMVVHCLTAARGPVVRGCR